MHATNNQQPPDNVIEATLKGDLEVIQKLLYDTPQTQELINNIFLYASQNNQVDIIKYLIESDDITVKPDISLWTFFAIRHASYHNFYELADYLLDRCMDKRLYTSLCLDLLENAIRTEKHTSLTIALKHLKDYSDINPTLFSYFSTTIQQPVSDEKKIMLSTIFNFFYKNSPVDYISAKNRLEQTPWSTILTIDDGNIDVPVFDLWQ